MDVRPLPARLSVIVALCATLSLAPVGYASEQQVLDAYQHYLKALEANDPVQTEAHAREAYQLAVKLLDESTPQIAALAMNWAGALEALAKQRPEGMDSEAYLAHRKQVREQAFERYQDALSHYERIEGKESEQLIEPLLGLGALSKEARQANAYYQRAIAISEGTPLRQASIQILAFDRLKQNPETVKAAKSHLLDAIEVYQKQLPENHSSRIEAEFRLGMMYAALGKRNKAIDALEGVVEQYEVLDFDHPLSLASRTRLVVLYERQGDREKATEHCVAVGQMRPWQESQEQVPLYRKEPSYPLQAARKGREGFAVLEFTVDEQGFVTDPKIIESEGGKDFERESIQALQQWRYAPRFEDGQAVPAKSLVRLDFSLGRPGQ
ncbi:energy transducer TonB [Ferrimonas balearica]|uniref:energy transducer TonB n=1 Tax=Ferrimonas balearica TaxID=44012 RepID=UPI001C9951CB|nr:energy transducer TonB [Ferrimonas balearica]MBY5921644.1 TonB family protein [Ferrimonas balearica]MBY5995016.1 TonB family protein [Ferrimonas balearica]